MPAFQGTKESDQMDENRKERLGSGLLNTSHTDETPRNEVKADPANSMDDELADEIRCALTLRSKHRFDIARSVTKLNQLFEDYQIIREIGRGGMGIVYEAHQVKLDRKVALKILPALLGAVHPETADRFRREAMLAAQLQHTNIIPVYDFGEVDGTLYYAMELINGRSLRGILKEIEESGAIDVVLGVTSSDNNAPAAADASPTRVGASNQSDRAYFRQVASWIAEIAEALEYAHDRGVIHRDVKPSNLLLATGGRLMLSDFGLARPAQDATLTFDQAVMGTCRYMSPEQLDKDEEDIDGRSDQYNLGATLYELLTFRPMFPGRDQWEIIQSILDDEPTPPRRLVRQVPQELEVICLKSVAKNRSDRYANAQALADDLRRWLLDLPITAQRPPIATRAIKYLRRRRVGTLLSLLCLTISIAAGVYYTKYRSSQRTVIVAEARAEEQVTRLMLFQAQSDYNAVRLETGLKRVEAVLRRQPDCIEALLLRGKFLRALGRNDDAIRHFKEVVDQRPDHWAGHYALALAYNQAGNELAVDHRREVERLKPETAPAYYLKALFETDPHRAITLLNAGLDLSPGRIELVMARSDRYRELGRYSSMLVDAEQAVALKPGWSNSHARKGQALFLLGRFQEAIRAYSRAISLDPKFAMWWSNRASSSHEIGNYMEAIADAEMAINLDPHESLYHIVRGRALTAFGDRKAAMISINRAIELGPDEARGYLERSVLHEYDNRWEDIIDDSKFVIQFAPADVRGYHNTAIALMRIGRYEEAINSLTSALHVAPDECNHHRIRAEAFLLLERYEEAIADLREFTQRNPAHRFSAMQLAIALELIGKPDEAVLEYQRAAQAKESSLRAYARLWNRILELKQGRSFAAGLRWTTDDPSDRRSAWITALNEILVGRATADDVLTESSTACKVFEAHYCMSVRAAYEKKREQAAEHLRIAMTLGRWRPKGLTVPKSESSMDLQEDSTTPSSEIMQSDLSP